MVNYHEYNRVTRLRVTMSIFEPSANFQHTSFKDEKKKQKLSLLYSGET